MTIFRLLTTMTTAGGKKTTHAVYGEALGILSGDALLNYAYETALSSLADGKQTDRKIRALRILANKSGVYGMLGGQSVDVQNEKMGSLSLSSQELDYIYLHKTSALLEASLEMGAVLAGAGEREAAAMEQIGRKNRSGFPDPGRYSGCNRHPGNAGKTSAVRREKSEDYLCDSLRHGKKRRRSCRSSQARRKNFWRGFREKKNFSADCWNGWLAGRNKREQQYR